MKTDDVMVDMADLWRRFDLDRMRDQDWDLLHLILEDFDCPSNGTLPPSFVDAVATRIYGPDR